MMNAWALSALWVGSALVATLLAIRFKISRALSKIVVALAQLIFGVISGVGCKYSAKQRNHFIGSIEITGQLNSKIRRCAVADLDFAMSCIFGATGVLIWA